MTKSLLPFESKKREILIKRAAETDPNLGCNPEKRPIEELLNYGIVNINKPKNPTSHQVSDFVQKILNIKKAGHSGTLDPAVTGVLPIALGRATRIVANLLTAGKEYVAIMHLHKEADEKQIKQVMKEFTGKIKQLPPIKSAIKRRYRFRHIYYIEILEIDRKDVLFKVGCEAGTYIRKLCLHPQTEILTEDGLIIASDFHLNHPVYSFSKGKMVKKNPSATQKIPSPSKLLKITMSSGINFIVTPDHRMLASKIKGYKMIEAQNLKQGDFLVKSIKFPNISKKIIISDLLDDYYLIPQKDIIDKCKKIFISKYGSIRSMNRELKLDRKAFLNNSNYAITIRHLKLAGIYEKIKHQITEFKMQKGTIIKMKSLNKDFFYLLGLIASDGNNTKEKKTARYTRIKFHNRNEELVDKFLKIYKRLFSNIPISKKKIKSNLFQLDTTNSFFATIAASLGIKSPQKDSDFLPILNADKSLIKSFLKGYFDGDGSVSYKKTSKNHKTRISFHTCNFNDADRIHKMLLKLNIPNKIFKKNVFSTKKYKMYEISIGNIAAEKKFIKEIGTNHSKKLEKFKKIIALKHDSEINDHYHIGLHYKEFIRENKSQLHRMGGNLNRVLKNNIPITRGFYKKASQIVKLTKLDDFIIEKIKSIEKVKGADFVYDMTVPGTHNFLIETGFVSSNCHNIGEKLGTGAHMAELRRTKAGPFDESTLITLQDLADAFWYYKNENKETQLRKLIQPIETAIQHLPKIWIVDSAIESITHGRDLAIPGISKLNEFEKDETVAIMSLKDELIATGKATLVFNKIMKEEKGIAVKTEKVFMLSGTYKVD